ncbi:MAG: hypothetical protein JEY91_03615 [Spirochaetaceae bacterium]|nr:hypothetical protein [Spirochaetaceae bacterium]
MIGNMQKVSAIHIKPVKKQAAEKKRSVLLLKDFGPQKDAYGGPGDRQITLLGQKDMEELKKDREKGICINRFIPNITITGSSKNLIKGRKYTLGETEIQISSVSKKCHEGCLLKEEENRICLLPLAARFASVLKSGTVTIDDSIVPVNS